jgi:hypothetical protein
MIGRQLDAVHISSDRWIVDRALCNWVLVCSLVVSNWRITHFWAVDAESGSIPLTIGFVTSRNSRNASQLTNSKGKFAAASKLTKRTSIRSGLISLSGVESNCRISLWCRLFWEAFWFLMTSAGWMNEWHSHMSRRRDKGAATPIVPRQ